jgi:hypothetical protein
MSHIFSFSSLQCEMECDLQLIPESALQELKPRDFEIANEKLLWSKFLQVCILFFNFRVALGLRDLASSWLQENQRAELTDGPDRTTEVVCAALWAYEI